MLYIIPIAWLYIVVLMALAEVTSPQGTVLGALLTLVLYGLLPLAIVMYVAGSPLRRKAAKRQELEDAARTQTDGSAHPPDHSG